MGGHRLGVLNRRFALMLKKRTTSKSYNERKCTVGSTNTVARLSALFPLSLCPRERLPLSVFFPPTERQSRHINTHFLIGSDCGHLSAIRPNRPSRPGAPYSPYRPDSAPLHNDTGKRINHYKQLVKYFVHSPPPSLDV